MAKMVTFDVEIIDENDEPVERTITAKSVSKMPYGIGKLFAAEAQNATDKLFEWGLDDIDREWIEMSVPLDNDNIPKILNAWSEASEMEPGKSPQRSRSSTGTAKRSKQTSSTSD